MKTGSWLVAGLLLAPLAVPLPAVAQQIDLSKGGPVQVTAIGGIEWRQLQQEVIATGDARAIRGGVTVTADKLIAHYRKKAAGPGPAAKATPSATGTSTPSGAGTSAASLTGEPDTGGTEIYLLEAVGNVHIFTATDQATGDRAVYDMDQAVLVLTGRHLKLTTPQDVLTARQSIEYWSDKHMAVARGDAVVVTKDGKRLSADVLVGYTTPGAPATGAPPAAGADPLASSGKLQKVQAIGHVRIRTATDLVQGDRGVYVPSLGIARLAGHVRITRGQNQLNGAEAIVNMKTGVSRLISAPGHRVEGLVVPNSANPPAPPVLPHTPSATTGSTK